MTFQFGTSDTLIWEVALWLGLALSSVVFGAPLGSVKEEAVLLHIRQLRPNRSPQAPAVLTTPHYMSFCYVIVSVSVCVRACVCFPSGLFFLLALRL